MFLGIILGFAALGLLSSAMGDSETETTDPVDEQGLRVAGGSGDDLLEGLGGDDRFSGKDGADLMIGRDGDDTLFGGDGPDSMHGDSGDDVLRGGGDDDLIVGGNGADQIRGDAGHDRIISAGILDEAAYHASQRAAGFVLDVATPLDYGPDLDAGDTVDGGAGDDDIIFGSDDQVTGGSGADLLQAGDWITPGAPATVSDYDAAEDVIVYSFQGLQPDVTVELDSDGTAIVSADGAEFLRVTNAGSGFSPAQILLQSR